MNINHRLWRQAPQPSHSGPSTNPKFAKFKKIVWGTRLGVPDRHVYMRDK